MKRIVQLFALVLVLAAVPALLPPYYVTLLNYIGISALVAVGLVLLTGVGGLTSLRPGRLRRRRGLHHRGAHHLDEPAGLDRLGGASPWLALAAGW